MPCVLQDSALCDCVGHFVLWETGREATKQGHLTRGIRANEAEAFKYPPLLAAFSSASDQTLAASWGKGRAQEEEEQRQRQHVATQLKAQV